MECKGIDLGQFPDLFVPITVEKLKDADEEPELALFADVQTFSARVLSPSPDTGTPSSPVDRLPSTISCKTAEDFIVRRPSSTPPRIDIQGGGSSEYRNLQTPIPFGLFIGMVHDHAIPTELMKTIRSVLVPPIVDHLTGIKRLNRREVEALGYEPLNFRCTAIAHPKIQDWILKGNDEKDDGENVLRPIMAQHFREWYGESILIPQKYFAQVVREDSAEIGLHRQFFVVAERLNIYSAKEGMVALAQMTEEGRVHEIIYRVLKFVYTSHLNDAHNTNVCFERESFRIAVIDTEPQGKMTMYAPFIPPGKHQNNIGLGKYITSVHSTCSTLLVSPEHRRISNSIQKVERLFVNVSRDVVAEFQKEGAAMHLVSGSGISHVSDSGRHSRRRARF